MTEVLMTCARCDEQIAIHMETTILRADVERRTEAELLFCCPVCGYPDVRHIVSEMLALLLFVGFVPIHLSEPSLPADDQAPSAAPLTPDDLLMWHEQLAEVSSVMPWERQACAYQRRHQEDLD